MVGSRSDLEAQLERCRRLVAQGRGLAAARGRRLGAAALAPAERSAVVALAADLGDVLEGLRRQARASGEDFSNSARRVNACLAYLAVGRAVHAPRR